MMTMLFSFEGIQSYFSTKINPPDAPIITDRNQPYQKQKAFPCFDS